MVPQGIGVACKVSIAGLEDHLVDGGCPQRGVGVRKLVSVDPLHGSGRGWSEVKTAFDGGLIDVVVERDPDRRGRRDVDGVALGRVVDDLWWVATTRRERHQKSDERGGQKEIPLLGPSLFGMRPARARRSHRRPPPRLTSLDRG